MYIKKYSRQVLQIGKKNLLVFFCLIFILETISMIVLFHMGFSVEKSTHFTDRTLAIIGATLLFVLTLKTRSFHSKFVNLFAGTVFSAYLLTDNPLTRGLIWNDFFRAQRFETSSFVILIGVFFALVLMILSFFIDCFRQIIFESFKNLKK